MHIVLIGTSLDALLLADQLASDHHVTMIEIEAEIGMPVHHPGRCIDIAHLSTFFTDDQQVFLALKENPDGWGCRWEWVLKFLSHHVATKGVTCLTRTRVVDMSVEGTHHLLHLSQNERHNHRTLMADMVIDCSTNNRTPGLRTHNLAASNVITYPFGELTVWHGMLVLQGEPTKPNNPTLVLERMDGLVEYWWMDDPAWMPSNGALEKCQTLLPASEDEVSFDAAVSRVARFLDQHL